MFTTLLSDTQLKACRWFIPGIFHLIFHYFQTKVDPGSLELQVGERLCQDLGQVAEGSTEAVTGRPHSACSDSPASAPVGVSAGEVRSAPAARPPRHSLCPHHGCAGDRRQPLPFSASMRRHARHVLPATWDTVTMVLEPYADRKHSSAARCGASLFCHSRNVATPGWHSLPTTHRGHSSHDDSCSCLSIAGQEVPWRSWSAPRPRTSPPSRPGVPATLCPAEHHVSTCVSSREKVKQTLTCYS